MNKQIISERTNLFEPNVYIGMYVEIDGNPPVELMKDAFQKAFPKNELTMSKVVIEKNGRAYYQRLEQSGCKAVFTESDWRSIIEENEKQPFAINCGELMRVFVKESGKIFIMAHHLVGDGKSIIILLQDALMVLAGNQTQYKPANIITKEFLQAKTKLNFFVRKYISYQNKVWEKVRKHYSWDDYDAIHKKYWEDHASNILTHTFNKEETEHIKEMAKAYKVTVNSYLISLILCVRNDINVVGIPIDIREDDKSMSNQVSGIAIKCKDVKKKKLKEKTKEVHTKIQKMLNATVHKYFVLIFMSELCPTLIDAVLLAAHGLTNNKRAKKVAYALGYKGMKKRDFGISNLGIIEMQTDYGQYKVDNVIFIPPSISYTENIMGVSTINERMTITYHGMKKDEENSWFKELVYMLRK
ncbi:hypothetical protein [Anaeromicropila herbilytica]|uniref:Condensation domain-containing protein n=1 Tax=Anaeromicropila herbilytica TaxID=2785025 RepID=A0A7R7IBU6_9FIRM|nr:hypothetical protein [Anaeromicropila herbilytica]BCN29166.1 hypothetical protein bsdtb5_04610 [Anaeromicropila herbilytica]